MSEKLIEAINSYQETKDVNALFKSVYFSELEEKEARRVLKDILKELYSDSDYDNFLAEIRSRYSKGTAPFRMADEEWEQAWGCSMEEILEGLFDKD